MIRRSEAARMREVARDPDRVVAAQLKGPRPSVLRRKRRLVGLQVALAAASVVASLVLYNLTGVERSLEEASPLVRGMYGFVGILVPAGHLGLVFLLISGVANAGRYAQRGAVVMVLMHLAWSGGIMVGHVQALPLGFVMVAGNLVFLWWLRPVRASLDSGKRAPAGLREETHGESPIRR